MTDDDITGRVTKVKKAKDAVHKKERGVPAGAQGGASGNTPKGEVTTGLRAILDTQTKG
jgi:hypothetical protein